MSANLEQALAQTEQIQIPDDIKNATPEEVTARTRMIENEIKMMKNELNRLSHEQKAMQERIKDNTEKIKLNRQLPYLVGNVVEVCIKTKMSVNFQQLLDADPNDEEQEGSTMDADATNKSGKCGVIKTSTRQVKQITLITMKLISKFRLFTFLWLDLLIQKLLNLVIWWA
jgi:26S proteasome regulatory subunit T5